MHPILNKSQDEIKDSRNKKELTKDQLREKYKNLNPHKLDLIDLTFQKIVPNAQSFADLGGAWGVDGGYTFYTLDSYNIKSGFLVDFNFNENIITKSQEKENLRLMTANFGEDSTLERLGKLDVIFLFDVLLHQVKPDWDEILKKYASICDCMVIFNQQLINSDRTIRLFDLGKEEYFKHVPDVKDQLLYSDLFEKLDENYPNSDRKWKDIQTFWQWGITDLDLSAKMQNLDFSLIYYNNHGHFGDLENIENHAFIFLKDQY